MKITEGLVATLSWRMTDSQGELIDENLEGDDFYVGGDDLLPRMAEQMMGKGAGDKGDIYLQPEDAFGDYDEELILVEDAKLFPDNIEIGMSFERVSEDGEEDMIYRITDIADGKVVVDGNHPLAGVALVFDVTVAEVRTASAEEITHGHVHGPGGHHHH